MSQIESRVLIEAVGQLTGAPQVSATAGGVMVCRFTLASERGPASNPVLTTVYVVGALARSCAALGEGDLVCVRGEQRQRIRRRRGVAYPALATEAREVELLGSASDAPAPGKLEPRVIPRHTHRPLRIRRRGGQAGDAARVVHCQRDPYDLYIGRGPDPRSGEPGRWGNPFRIGEDGDREQVIERYRSWLWRQIKAGEVDLADLAALHGKVLGCWCAPQPCHGEVLASAAAWAAERAR